MTVAPAPLAPQVNNAYVLQKLRILLVPYTHKEWERKSTTAPGGTYMPRPPSEDFNAPDLYLPLMVCTMGSNPIQYRPHPSSN